MENKTSPHTTTNNRDHAQLLELFADALHFENATVAEGDWGRLQLVIHYWSPEEHADCWGFDLHVWATDSDGKKASRCLRWGYHKTAAEALFEGLKQGDRIAALLAAGETVADAPADPRYPDV